MSELSNILTKLKTVAESVKGEIQALDEQIGTLNQERQALVDAPVSRDEYAAYVKADVARRGELFLNRMRMFAKGKGRGNAKFDPCFATLERVYEGGRLQNLPFMNGEDSFDGFNPSPEAFYWYFGDLIAERFMAALDAVHTWPQAGIPLADRRRRIAEIDQVIDDLVTQRDELASQLMSVGITE